MEIEDTSGTTPLQMRLDLEIAAEREIDGVGMGVLSDGTPFLNIRGLAEMCGVEHSQIVRITAAWQENPLKPRESKIKELVRAQGKDDNVCFIATMKNGTIHHSIPSAVCMAVLEYYAFEARSPSEKAAKSYRRLARKGFDDFIYAQVGYNPSGSADIAWKQYQDRVSLVYDAVPEGYFSIFKEMASILVTLINKGALLDAKFIPDISMGIAWSKYWVKENLDIIHGERIKYDHSYPSYFAQALSNPQEAWCYPDEALAEFRKWVKSVYLANQFPKYIEGKVKSGAIAAPKANAAIKALRPSRLN